MAVAFFVLLARLYYLQVIKGEYYVRRSESNFIQERVIKHSRGKIFDANGKILVDNRLSYDLYVTFAMLPNSLRYLRLISASLDLSRAELVNLEKEISLRAENQVSEELSLPGLLKENDCHKIEELLHTQLISGVKIIYDNARSCSLKINSVEFPSHQQAFQNLVKLLGHEREFLSEKWQKAQSKSQGLARFKPNLLIADIGFDSYARIENAISLGKLSGINVVSSKKRRYVYGDMATHLIGFLNQVSLDELKQSGGKYRSGDFVGRRGVEATYENDLKGQDGIERLVVDAKGRRYNKTWEQELIGDNRIIEPKPGLSIKLSIDVELQKAAQQYFQGISGSVVVMDAQNGFIKALASFPSFDPNIMLKADNGDLIKALMENKKRPFRNKALQDHYSPGSTFKPITAIAGLSRHLVTTSSSYHCSGSFRLHRTTWRCFRRYGHGDTNMLDALKKSCDTFFYDLGYQLGLDNLSDVAAVMGFGQKTDIALLGESAGILPSSSYYKKRLGYVPPGAVVNMAIGQGDLNITPLQLAVAYSAIANGGVVYQPQLATEFLDESGEVVQSFPPIIKSKISDSSYNLNEILAALAFVAEPGGSAYGLRYKPEFSDISQWLKKNNLGVVGKTGTAQVVKLAKNIDHLYEVDKIPYEQRDHAWFVGIFPREKPQIVTVVMTEHGGFASSVSAPVAVRLMKKWHELTQLNINSNGESVP